MKRLIVPALLLLLPFWGFAQFKITGQVVNRQTNQTLPGTTLVLLGNLQSTVADNNGNFTFSNLKPASYKLVASYLGFGNDTTLINLDKNLNLSLSLQPSAILIDEIIVRATRAGNNTPVAHQNIDKKEIASTNFGQDLPMLLGNSISAVSTSDAGNGMGYSALRIRGTDMTRINVTINGIPLNDPESHNVYWVDLPDFATSTDNVQIQRGVGTSTNGASAFGASINLQSTHLKTEPYAELSSNYGTFNTLKNSVSFGTGLFNKQFSMDARISKLSSDGYIARASSELLSYYISGAYTSGKNLLRLNVFSGIEKTYQAWGGLPSELLETDRTYNGMGSYVDNKGNQQYYDNQTDNYTQTHYQALFSHKINENLFLNAALHHTKGAGYYEQYKESEDLADYNIAPIRINSNYYTIENDTVFVPDSLISVSDIIRQKHLDNAFTGLTWSLNYQTKKLQSSLGGSWNTYDGGHFGKVIWSQFAGNSQINHEWYDNDARKNDFNIFMKTEYGVTDKLSAWLDLQFRGIYYSISGIDDDLRDITQKHTYNFFNPKAGVSYKISTAQKMYASFSQAKREPNRDNFVDANPAQPLPQPETLYDAEAGYAYSSTLFSVSANIYYMNYKDQLVLTGAINDVGAAVMVNVPSSYRAGIEISGKASFTKNLTWEPTITLSRNKIKSFTEYIDNWDTWGQIAAEHSNTDLSFSPSTVAGSSFNWLALKGLKLSLISKYVGQQFIDNTQSTDRQLDAYFINNILISYTLNPAFVKEISISLMANNIFNENYESNAWVYRYSSGDVYQKLDGYFPQAGVNFMAGVVVKM